MVKPVTIDLGSAVHDEAKRFISENFLVTAQWRAPEMIGHGYYNFKMDILALCVVMWEVLTGHIPFADKSEEWTTNFVWNHSDLHPGCNGLSRQAKALERNL